jgi:hypothetical protein
MDDFPGNLPGNSHTSKLKQQQATGPEKAEGSQAISDAEGDAPKQVKKVTSGKVTTRRKPLSQQFRDMFSNKDEQSFIDYLLNDVAVPMVQELMVNIVAQTMDGIKNGVEDRITGNRTKSSTSRTSYGTGRPVNYNAQYRTTPARTVVRASAPAPRVTIRRSNRIQDIILSRREDGLDVLDELKDKIEGFGHCTVGDLYTTVGVVPKSTDQEWGWDNLEEGRVRRISDDEYQLVLPRPIEIQYES